MIRKVSESRESHGLVPSHRPDPWKHHNPWWFRPEKTTGHFPNLACHILKKNAHIFFARVVMAGTLDAHFIIKFSCHLGTLETLDVCICLLSLGFVISYFVIVTSHFWGA